MTLLCCLKRVQNPNAAPNIWINIQFLATQKQTKLLGDWEELHQKKNHKLRRFIFILMVKVCQVQTSNQIQLQVSCPMMQLIKEVLNINFISYIDADF